jgi:hypothetical protein
MSYQNQPLGTIIASILNYDLLCALMKEQKGVNTKTSTYAPCDGRLITDSQLEISTRVSANQPDPKFHIQKTPDIRGKFVRGLNQFYSVGETPFDSTAYGDAQGTRAAGDYQQDTLTDHTHNYKIGNFQNNAEGGSPRAYVGADYNQSLQSTGVNETPKISAETRPRNIAVYYYIKIN